MFAIACGLLLKIKQRVSSRPDHKFPPKNGFGRLAVVGGRDLISCELVAYSTAIFQVRLLHVLKQAKQYLRARRVVAALTDFGDDFALSSNVLLAQRHVTVDFGEMFNQDRPVHKEVNRTARPLFPCLGAPAAAPPMPSALLRSSTRCATTRKLRAIAKLHSWRSVERPSSFAR
jgi:hypothetical protein